MTDTLKVDFIHVGYHKTASTWLQLDALPAHPGIEMVNDAASRFNRLFVDSFVEIGELEFSREGFERDFCKPYLAERKPGGGKIQGISEENISGHYWNGAGEKVLAERLREIFGPVKIIIFVREQVDMMRSLYNNYVKTGGTLSLESLFKDTTLGGGRIYAKLCYHRLVEKYIELFSKENVLVLPFESLRDDPQALMDRFFAFVGAAPFKLPERVLRRKTNPGLSAPSETAMRWANRLFGGETIVQRAIRSGDRRLLAKWLPSSDARAVSALIPTEQKERWRQSNRALERRLGLGLARHNYVL